jgi:DNA-binding YbaB/EbfC family protein
MTRPELGALLEQAREMQTRLAAVRRELARRTVEGSAGGGLVVAVATGELRIQRVTIDPELLAGADREMLQDLVAAAVNAALTQARSMAQEELQKATGLPLGLGVLGGPA